MPKLVLTELRGMDANKASFQLKPGDAQFLQNVWTRPFKNWHKRNGVEPVSEQDGPVFGIFEVDLDNIVIPITANGGVLTFFPTYTATGAPLGGGDPFNTGSGTSSEDLDPEGGRTTLFLVEPVMRALSERYAVLAGTPPTWPNRHFDEYGNYSAVGTAPTIARNVNEWRSDAASTPFTLPTNNFYQYDLEWADKVGGTMWSGFTIAAGSAQGTYAAGLMNLMRTSLSSLLTTYSWVDTDIGIEGQASATDWTAVTLPLPAVATSANYRQRYSQLRTAVRKLESFNFTLSQIEPNGTRSGAESKSGRGYQAASCAAAVSEAAADFAADAFVYSGTTIYVQEYEYFADGMYEVSMTSTRGRLKSDTSIYIGGGNVAYYLKVNLLAAAPQGVSAYNPPVTADSLLHRYGGSSLGSVDYSATLGGNTPTPTGTCPIPAPTYDLNGWRLDNTCIGNILPAFHYQC